MDFVIQVAFRCQFVDLHFYVLEFFLKKMVLLLIHVEIDFAIFYISIEHH